MLSRRTFLKSIGLGAAAVSAGIGTGKLLNGSSNLERFSLYGFIPSGDETLKEIVNAFCRNKNFSHSVIFADADIKSSLEPELSRLRKFSGGNLFVRITKINQEIESDILLSDNKTAVYDPESDFNLLFDKIRNKIKNSHADLCISIDYRETNFLSSLKLNEKHLVIENENGICDKIPIERNYHNIPVKSVCGGLIVAIDENGAKVNSSTCSHKLCMLQGYASQPGDIIACAPNKILMRVELT
jgi:hypothetical protein